MKMARDTRWSRLATVSDATLDSAFREIGCATVFRIAGVARTRIRISADNFERTANTASPVVVREILTTRERNLFGFLWKF